MRIRWRLALLGTVLTAGTVVLFALLIVALASAAGPTDQDRALDTVAAAAVRDFVPGGSPALTVDVGETLDPGVVVLDRSGRVLLAQARVGGAAPAVPASLVEDAVARGVSRATVSVDGVELRMVGRAADGPDGVVAVAVQQTAVLDSQLRGLWFVVLLSAVLTALAGAVASWVVSGRALRPLRTLAATTAQIARTGEMTRRLDVPRTTDDVGVLAREFNAMMDRLASTQAGLAAALEQQRRFVADASHELRTPLSTVRANAGFLADRPDAAAADRAEALADLRAEADRMSRLVDDLLVLARTDALPQPERRPVDVRALAADVARQTGARLADGPPAVVLGDEDLLRRLVRCLVDNAVVHGGGDVEVSVQRAAGAPPAPAWVLVSVRDHGPGFPPEALEQVFERFHRGDRARSGTGSGLGLAIARSVAALHGGGVSAANAPDGGALVTAHLPG